MPRTRDAGPAPALARHVHRLTGDTRDFDPLLALIGDAHVVLLGEASHGTHEFYRIRGEITKRLIREKGFTAVAVEADWPDAYRVNRYVRGRLDDSDATDALGGFSRFPQWMWRNADVLDFIGWLREHNDQVAHEAGKAGFYGLDLYSLHASMGAVLEYLRVVDPEAAARARERYACFDHFGGDPQVYGQATTLGLSPSCEREVLGQLVELRASAAEYARRDGRVAADARFFAEQNAQVVANAESYYREMFRSRVGSWNIRDTHMAETLDALRGFLETQGTGTRVVVWAHNSHLGDARATEMGRHGEHNVGQLVRQQHGTDAVLVGFTTFDGTVTAARDWDAPAERRTVRPALAASYEALLHEVVGGNAFLDLRTPGGARELLSDPRLERAIGVIYRPESERASHYFQARLPRQFDAVMHYDHSRAVEPLARTALWVRGEAEPPETWPFEV
jgi:erythromycin esterase-like protein